MSFVKKLPAQRVNSQFQLELVPNPVTLAELSEEQKVAQQNAIAQVTRVSSGLFLPNPAVSVGGDIKSGQNYNAGVKVSQLASAMEAHDLVVRVSLSGDHTACAMATASDLLENASVTSPSGSFSLGITGNYIRNVDFM